jgi:hypothetical protein
MTPVLEDGREGLAVAEEGADGECGDVDLVVVGDKGPLADESVAGLIEDGCCVG